MEAKWKYDPDCICDRCVQRSQFLAEPGYPPVGKFTAICFALAAIAITTGVYLFG